MVCSPQRHRPGGARSRPGLRERRGRESPALPGLLCPLLLCLWLVGLAGTSVARAAEEGIGGIRSLTGTVTLVRQGTPRPAALGTVIHLRDEVRTGPSSSVGIVLDDETRLALGPESALVIDEMVYRPASDAAGLTARLLSGTLGYVSGGIARFRPEAVTLETPTATIGIRGTRLAVKAGAP